MKLVLAHDSLTQLGGAERVFIEMAELFPEAPIYVLVADEKVVSQLPQQVQRRIVTTKLQWLYKLYPKFQHLLPFIPFMLWITRLPECDVLLSSSSAFAKGFRKPKGSRHINYCHTPTRFLWTDREYIVQEVPWLVRLPARIFLRWMKWWDLRAAKNVDFFLANSVEVQQRVEKYYDRTSEVVYPFVDTEFWKPTSPPVIPAKAGIHTGLATSDADLSGSQVGELDPRICEDDKTGGGYFLIAGRLHAHKHNDLVVEVCTQLGLPLHVVGSGRDEAHLKSIAGPTVTFLGRVTDEKLREEFSGARAYIYPQLEDFGLMPVEAASCGTPTIGIDEGGSRETIVPGVTGEWFSKGSKEELKGLLEHFNESKYSVEVLRKHAEQFSKEIFRKKIEKVVCETSKAKN